MRSLTSAWQAWAGADSPGRPTFSAPANPGGRYSRFG